MAAAYTHLLWDFNGTILDDVRLCMNCVNRMLEKRGMKTIPDETAYRQVFGFPIEDYYRRLGFDFDREDYATVLAPEWVSYYLAEECRCSSYAGVAETLAQVAQQGIPQAVLSATEVGQLRGQLNRLGFLDRFEGEIWGLDNIRAGSKFAMAQAWMEAHPQARPLFFGDTEHDAAVAASVHADCVLFTGGHQSPERLATCGLPMVNTSVDLLPFLFA